MSKGKVESFVEIPKETLLSDRYTQLPCNAKVTYLGLLTHWFESPNQKEYKVRIGYKRLTETTGLSRSTLWKAINQLCEGNDKDKFISNRNSHVLYCTNEYKLNPRWCIEKSHIISNNNQDIEYDFEYDRGNPDPHGTKQWKELREKLIPNGKCVTCESTERLVLHHLNKECYFNETEDDVQVLCNSCHSKLKGKLRYT